MAWALGLIAKKTHPECLIRVRNGVGGGLGFGLDRKKKPTLNALFGSGNGGGGAWALGLIENPNAASSVFLRGASRSPGCAPSVFLPFTFQFLAYA